MALAAKELPKVTFPISPQLRSPGAEIVGFYTDPPGVVMQFAQPVKGTEELARWLLVHAIQQIFARFPGRNDILFVMDLRMMAGRELGARSLLVQHGPGLRHRFSHLYILPPLVAAPFYAGTLHTAASLLRTLGLHIDIEPSMERIFAVRQLRFSASP
jgi:hypothetical protein